jgi:hypothetical protein
MCGAWICANRLVAAVWQLWLTGFGHLDYGRTILLHAILKITLQSQTSLQAVHANAARV